MTRPIRTVARSILGGWHALLDCGHTVLLGYYEQARKAPRKGCHAVCPYCKEAPCQTTTSIATTSPSHA